MTILVNRKWKQFINENVKVYVHGYVKPASAFYTIAEWEAFANQILKLQKDGHSIRGGNVDGPDELKQLTNNAFKQDIFGAPTFVVNNKIFWGQDRLDYALEEYNS